MGKITNALNSAKKKVSDWWDDDINRTVVIMVATLGVTCFTEYEVGKLIGAKTQFETDIKHIVGLEAQVGKLSGENEMLRQIVEAKNN